eukprot:scaffold98_cov78-Cylindrotheca_fusiformis.AAC.3
MHQQQVPHSKPILQTPQTINRSHRSGWRTFGLPDWALCIRSIRKPEDQVPNDGKNFWAPTYLLGTSIFAYYYYYIYVGIIYKVPLIVQDLEGRRNLQF